MTDSVTRRKKMQIELEQLKEELGLDFVAVALADGQYRDIYWRFALGANSERYKKIAVRMGKGMAGKVLQGFTPYVVTEFPEDVQEEVLEYPIFLVESLKSGMGVTIKSPLPSDMQSNGVLLVGQRSKREFLENDIDRVQLCASVLAELYDSYPLELTDSEYLESHWTQKYTPIISQDIESITQKEAGPIVKLLHEAQSVGISCELLDQRITRLSNERQEEIAAILTLLVKEYTMSTEAAQLVIGQDELGQTLIEFEGNLLHPASQELFLPVMAELKSLKCDLEIVIEKEKQSVRFTIPTRILLDEMNWNN